MQEDGSLPSTPLTTAPPLALTAAAWAALDACAEGVTILDPDGLIRYVNPASAAMGDSSVEESLGRNLWQEYPALVGTEFHAAITTAAAQDEPVEWHAYYGPNQGWYRDRAQRIGGPGGPVVVVFTRVDDAQQAEATRQRLTAQVQVALARNQLLLTASEQLAQASTVEDVAARIGQLTATPLAPTSIGLYLLDPAGGPLRLVPTLDSAPPVRADYELIARDSPLPVAQVARTGKSLFYDDVDTIPAVPVGGSDLRADLRATDAHAAAVVPVPGPDEVLGALALAWKRPRPLDVSDRAVLTTLASYAGTAVTRIRRAAERLAAIEHRYAEARAGVPTRQRTALPDLPVLPAVELVAHYLPADTELAAGGDWYDAVVLPNGRLALVVGDVVGHGPLAAAAMARLRTLSEHLLRTQPTLSEVLAHLNTSAALLTATRAATIVVAVLDRDGGLSWACQGHPAPVRLTAAGDTEVLATWPGPPLGTSGSPVPIQRGSLEPGDTLLLASDGLLERVGRDVRGGLDQLCAAAAELQRRQPVLAPFATELLHTLTGDGADDDVTLLAARRHTQPVHPLTIEVDGRPAELPGIRRVVANWLEALNVDDDDLIGLELIVVEAATNAVEHAYRGQGLGPVRVLIALDDTGQLCIEVADHGSWQAPAVDPGIRGRGLQLIRSLSDTVEITTGDHGTTVTARRALRRTPILTANDRRVVRPDRSRPRYRAVVQHGEPTIITIGGVIDATVEQELRTDLLGAARGGGVELVVELDQVVLLASAGVRVLHELAAALPLHLRAAPKTPARTALDLAALHPAADAPYSYPAEEQHQ